MANGVMATPVEFAAKEADNFSTTTSYGANGWMCTPDPFDLHTDSLEADSSRAEFSNDPEDNFPDSPDPDSDNDDTLDKSLFFVDRQHAESDHSEHSCDCDHSMPEDDF
jgi:hypothetical protein